MVRVREPRKSTRAKSTKGAASDRGDDGDARGLKGSTRLEAKKQRRREGRDAGRRRPAVITEAEFLARRESVDRVMVVRQTGERTQIGVLEDGILVEHYVSTASSAGTLGNVYLGKVQNVLPSMEAAFVDVGKGRNAVLYAGEVNWDAAGMDGQPKRIEQALKPNDSVLVQVTKDPIGHKGARLTSQISLAGRYLVFVPHGSMTGISRKLPENERTRLKSILKKVVPEDAGVIVRTAAEGASEEELSRDVARLTAQWEDIEKKAKTASAPALLYGEPDLTIRVVRDIFNEDFAKLIVSGDDAWEMLEPYVGHVAPDLRDRMSRWTSEEDVFAAHRIDEQLAKALDRKVWLPSGGYLIIDRTEAMIVIDVNTGKFTGAGGNLEETVTKNNVEAAEEIVRQLRLRDLGGMIVIDFIDMVLESNRELVLRRMLECLGRDRTKHQVAEVTSLGLVQMTRKRVGQGLFEAFSETCEACNGRGVHIRTEPVEAGASGNGGGSSERKNGRSRGGSDKPGGSRGSGSGRSGAAAAARPPARRSPSRTRSSRPQPRMAGSQDPVPRAPVTRTPATRAPATRAPATRAPATRALARMPPRRRRPAVGAGGRSPRSPASEFDPVAVGFVPLTLGAPGHRSPPCARSRNLCGPLDGFDLFEESESAVYAIVRAGGRQEKVAVGDVLEIDRLDAEPGASVTLPVLLLVDGTDVTSDKKTLSGATVTVEVVGGTKGPKIDILKYKNKTGYRRRSGHRQKHTQVKVTGIDSGSKK